MPILFAINRSPFPCSCSLKTGMEEESCTLGSLSKGEAPVPANLVFHNGKQSRDTADFLAPFPPAALTGQWGCSCLPCLPCSRQDGSQHPGEYQAKEGTELMGWRFIHLLPFRGSFPFTSWQGYPRMHVMYLECSKVAPQCEVRRGSTGSGQRP